MPPNEEELQARIRNPQESLDTELKQWLDPTTPEGEAKIARACIALRNNNGGFLIIGFKNDGTPDSPPQSVDVREVFHVDVVQGIVGRYASASFEISVGFPLREIDGAICPVICVPSGAETPVAAKRELKNPDGSRPPLIQRDAVYVRTLNSNNTVSTSAATHRDWDRITRICFDNREADIGAFIRRHLSGVNLGKLRAMFEVPEPSPTAAHRAVAFLDEGRRRFDAIVLSREITVPNAGTREASIAIGGNLTAQWPLDSFLNTLQRGKPKHTGWTPWVDTRNAFGEHQRPYAFAGGWEAVIVETNPSAPFGEGLDFWRMQPDGLFYHLRGLEDDLQRPGSHQQPPPGTQLDFMMQISRVAEFISIGLSFARSLGAPEADTQVAYAFRWRGMRGRRLSSWVEPLRGLHSPATSEEDEKTTSITVPLETSVSGIGPFVQAATNPLFEMFGGMRIEAPVVEEIVSRTLSRTF